MAEVRSGLWRKSKLGGREDTEPITAANAEKTLEFLLPREVTADAVAIALRLRPFIEPFGAPIGSAESKCADAPNVSFGPVTKNMIIRIARGKIREISLQVVRDFDATSGNV